MSGNVRHLSTPSWCTLQCNLSSSSRCTSLSPPSSTSSVSTPFTTPIVCPILVCVIIFPSLPHTIACSPLYPSCTPLHSLSPTSFVCTLSIIPFLVSVAIVKRRGYMKTNGVIDAVMGLCEEDMGKDWIDDGVMDWVQREEVGDCEGRVRIRSQLCSFSPLPCSRPSSLT